MRGIQEFPLALLSLHLMSDTSDKVLSYGRIPWCALNLLPGLLRSIFDRNIPPQYTEKTQQIRSCHKYGKHQHPYKNAGSQDGKLTIKIHQQIQDQGKQYV